MEYTNLGGPGGPRISTLALGVMTFGAVVEEATSFAILDRFREAGGTFIDTADCYCFWIEGRTGRESEELLGRWLAARGCRDDVVLSTKVGAQPDPALAGTWPRNAEGLSNATVRAAADGSLERLRTDHVEILFAHIQDLSVELRETVGAFAELITDGKIGAAGVSNHPTSVIRTARAAAAELAVPPYTAVQQRHSFLRPRPGASFYGYGPQVAADEELLALVRTSPDLSMMAYSFLIEGALVREDRPLPWQYDTAQNQARRQALWRVAAEAGVTRTQLALAWLLRGETDIVPIIGVSSVAQLDDALGALDVPPDAVAELVEAAEEA
ncbi:MAG: aldo/keto reductase [Catenulispora sp.]|nr:aldo/keto reductase [Catenulispora sp.]